MGKRIKAKNNNHGKNSCSNSSSNKKKSSHNNTDSHDNATTITDPTTHHLKKNKNTASSSTMKNCWIDNIRFIPIIENSISEEFIGDNNNNNNNIGAIQKKDDGNDSSGMKKQEQGESNSNNNNNMVVHTTNSTTSSCCPTTISIISWNVLANSYCNRRSHRNLPYRYQNIVFHTTKRTTMICHTIIRKILIEKCRTNILCLQEVDLNIIGSMLRTNCHYSGIETPRNGSCTNTSNSTENGTTTTTTSTSSCRSDACAIYVDNHCDWLIQQYEYVYFDDLAHLSSSSSSAASQHSPIDQQQNEQEQTSAKLSITTPLSTSSSTTATSTTATITPPPTNTATTSNATTTNTTTSTSNVQGIQQSFLRRNVGIVIRLQHKIHTHQTIVLANAHFFWNPSYEYVKLCQAHYLLQRSKLFCSSSNEPYLLCGDFNSRPQGITHSYLSYGTVNAKLIAPWYNNNNNNNNTSQQSTNHQCENEKNQNIHEKPIQGNNIVVDDNNNNKDDEVDEDIMSHEEKEEESVLEDDEHDESGGCGLSSTPPSNSEKNETKIKINHDDDDHIENHNDTTAAAAAGLQLPVQELDRLTIYKKKIKEQEVHLIQNQIRQQQQQIKNGDNNTNFESSSGMNIWSTTNHTTTIGSSSSANNYSNDTSENLNQPKIRYLLDATLNKFCRWLRILGQDAALETEEEEILRTSEGNIILFERCITEQRTLVTTSTRLIHRRDCPASVYCISPQILPNLEVALVHMFLTHGVILEPTNFLSRCVMCNGSIVQVHALLDKKRILAEYQAPAELLNDNMDVYECDGCQQGYWWCDRPTSSASRVKNAACELFELCLRAGVPCYRKPSDINTRTTKKQNGTTTNENHKDEVDNNKNDDDDDMFRHLNEMELRKLGWDFNMKGSELLNQKLDVIDWLKNETLQCPFELESAYALKETYLTETDDTNTNTNTTDGKSAGTSTNTKTRVIGESLPFTNITYDFVSTLDYIFFDKTTLKPISTLYVPKSFEELNYQNIPYGHLLPSDVWPSDHLAVGATFVVMEQDHQSKLQESLDVVASHNNNNATNETAHNNPATKIESSSAVKKDLEFLETTKNPTQTSQVVNIQTMEAGDKIVSPESHESIENNKSGKDSDDHNTQHSSKKERSTINNDDAAAGRIDPNLRYISPTTDSKHHPDSCQCCIPPPVPSMFEMARLRKLARIEKEKKDAADALLTNNNNTGHLNTSSSSSVTNNTMEGNHSVNNTGDDIFTYCGFITE